MVRSTPLANKRQWLSLAANPNELNVNPVILEETDDVSADIASGLSTFANLMNFYYENVEKSDFGKTTLNYKVTDNSNFTAKTSELVIISCNMHGFNQELSTILELIKSNASDIFILEEHWLTPDNMLKFDHVFPDLYMFC